MTHNLVQGSPEWQEFRLTHFGASEAAAMLGLSKKVKRNELLHMKHTGNAKEFSEWVQTNILDHGHVVEAQARPLVESMIGEDLYPVTCSLGLLSASCDGLTMSDEIAFEHKQWNTAHAALVAAGELPEEHMPQCQQIMLVTGAEKVVFVMSDGTADSFVSMEVLPDQAWFDRIVAGWKQFEIDLADYVPAEVVFAPVATPTLGLPALTIHVEGSIALKSNLTLFGEKLQAFVENIDKEPTDDQGFADAENAVKTLQKAEDALSAAEDSALAQTASIDEMRRMVEMYRNLARDTRLAMEKVVKSQKEKVRAAILQGGKDKFADHVTSLNKRIGWDYMPFIAADFAGAMKGKKTIASLRDAVDTELARVKIEANAIADKIQINIATLQTEGENHKFLFADVAQIVLKDKDDLLALVKMRIAAHDAAEEQRKATEREKIRVEEEAKATAKAQAEMRAATAAHSITAAATEAVISKPSGARSAKAMPVGHIADRVSDQQIIDAIAEMFNMTKAEAIKRIANIDLVAAHQSLAAVAA
ncbi:YqaJ viral recombinase family protein [Herminiimonas contaminans]|uniref:YqaJ viral recombinase family protein n=1 Tax=Herminiimonas contaminans TaxID=1111140 RepID=A0ABS0EXF9_9BURK|nr:YqaJ viral recombinase family protein [Herminiimonas contaminans]